MSVSSTLSADQTASSTVSADQTASSTLTATNARLPVRIVTDGLLTESATFTRADEATYFNSSGLLQTAAANEARTTYIGGNPYLWSDGEVTEETGYAGDLDNGWSLASGTGSLTKDIVGLDGESNTGWTFTDTDSGTATLFQRSTTIANDALDRFVVFAIKNDPTPDVYSAVALRLGGGTAVEERVLIDPSTGAFTELASGGSIVIESVQFGDYWMGVIKAVNNSSGNIVALSRCFPAYNADGAASIDTSATGSTGVGYIGLFETSFSLMPILTTGGTTATVAAEVASLTNSIISGLTEGTIYAEIWSPQLTANAARHIAELESDANNFIRVFIASGGDIDAQITSGGTSQAALAGPAHTVGTLHKVALVFGPSGFALYSDGTQRATGTGTVPSVDTLLIGAGLYGGIRTMNIEVSERSQASAEALTS